MDVKERDPVLRSKISSRSSIYDEGGRQLGRLILPKVIRGDLMEEVEYLAGLQDEFQWEKGGSNLPKLKN